MLNFGSWLEIIRPVNALMTALGVAVGYFLTEMNFSLEWKLGIAMLSAILVSCGGMVINDYFDRFIDAKIKPWRPIPSGRIKAWLALAVSLVFFAFGVASANWINQACLVIAGFASALLITYSAILSKTPLLGNAAIALNTGLTFIYGEAAATGGVLDPNVAVLFILAFGSTLAREIYKDIEDMPGDEGVRKSIPMVIGVLGSKFIASLVIILTVIASPIPYMLGFLDWKYMTIVGVADIIFIYISIASLLKDKIYSGELKIAQLLGLLAFLIGI